MLFCFGCAGGRGDWIAKVPKKSANPLFIMGAGYLVRGGGECFWFVE